MKHNLAKFIVPREHTFPDPRIAVAVHIGWSRPKGLDTDFHVPEPDNFNYGMKTKSLMSCPHVDYQIFYKDHDGLWWNLYLITQDNKEDFLTWADPIDVVVGWNYTRTPKQRRRKPLLSCKKSLSEMTLNERLYTMGYYDKLGQISPTAAETLNERMGSLRTNVPNWPPKWHTGDEELEES